MTGSCPLPSDYEEYLVKPAKVVGPFTTQNILFFIALGSTILSIAITLVLILKHLHRYTEPKQQRQIIRVIFTPVAFSVICTLCILNYTVAKYLDPLLDLYESFGLAAVFMLCVEFVAPDERSRLQYFATLENREPKSKLQPWKGYKVVPGGSQRWYQRHFTGVFLYPTMCIFTTVIQVASTATNDYCKQSWKPRYAHIWVFAIKNFFLGWAVDSIIRYYGRMKKEPEFAIHKPGAKIFGFKLIVGITFLQNIIFGFIDVKTNEKFTEYDLKDGCPYALMAIEQVFFAAFFHYAFRSREYHESMKSELAAPRMGIFRAAANAFNPIDIIKNMGKALQNIFRLISRKAGARGRTGPTTSHLEPMLEPSQPPAYSANMSYPPRQPNFATTEPHESGTTYAPGYTSVAYPPTASFARGHSPAGSLDNGADREGSRLSPYNNYYSHSRDPSVERGEARSTRELV